MELDTIKIDREAARAKVNEYRALEKSKWSAEDALIARGYLEAAEGRTLIRLSESIISGGLDERSLPRLAVARADQPWCYLSTQRNTESMHVTFRGAASLDTARNVAARDRVMRVTFPGLPSMPSWQDRDRLSNMMWSGRALRSQVPVVPPALRPQRGRLALYHVLWEVDEWATSPEPPVDPALIRRVGGDLWAVHAVWDLTELERAVIGGRV